MSMHVPPSPVRETPLDELTEDSNVRAEPGERPESAKAHGDRVGAALAVPASTRPGPRRPDQAGEIHEPGAERSVDEASHSARRFLPSQSTGEALARRGLLAPPLAALVLGTLIYLGMRSDWYGPMVGFVLLILTAIGVSVLHSLITAGALQSAERALRQSEEHVHALIESGSGYIMIFDREGAITYVGPSVEKLLGYRPEQVLGKRTETLIHPGDLPHVHQMIGAIFAAPGKVVRLEFRIRAEDGSWRVFESLGRTLRADSGDSGAVVNARDVTAHKEAERLAEIAEREGREKTALLESTSEGVYGLDLRGCCTFVNGAALRMLGYAPEECMGQNMHRLMHHTRPDGTHYPEEECFIFQAFRQGRAVRAENEVLWRKDGTSFPAFYSSSPIWQDGVVQGAVITFADITDYKAAEQALRRAKAEAENANRAKSEFLSRMSHELRTPMNSILGFGQLLVRQELSGDKRRSVDHILRAGKHLLRLIDEVLDLARIEANRQQISLEPVKVDSVVQEAISLIRPLAEQYDCMVVDARTENNDFHVRADRQRLTQVLLNLLSNAIKYNRRGGSVTVWCDKAAGAGGRSLEEDRLRIHVRDTGRGIPTEKLNELFVPFSRLGAEQTDIEGTGLGLALSLRLVEAMGGHLSVESLVGEGSTFSVQLTLTESPIARWASGSAETAGSPAPERAMRAATLLYIEDNLANFSLIQSILAPHPQVHLIPALQGRRGLELAGEHLPDLILLDLHLPDTPGDEVLRQLRSDARTRDIPVIIISADATPSRSQRLRAAGADDYVTKPLDVDVFLEAVDRVLGAAEARRERSRVEASGGPHP
jgi:PAS domain S-box-containing protein